jgi:hypothetical protein
MRDDDRDDAMRALVLHVQKNVTFFLLFSRKRACYCNPKEVKEQRRRKTGRVPTQ